MSFRAHARNLLDYLKIPPRLRRVRDDKVGQSGNALVYVLIAIALFAALTLTLGRQTDTSETGAIDEGQLELHATGLINYATQAKSVVDQMSFVTRGDIIGNLDFTLPTDGAFNTAPHRYKIYHPDGGGLNPANLPEDVKHTTSSDPVAGWYMGRFNNVEWTTGSSQDVLLVAWNITKGICESINEKVTGSTTIPKLSDDINTYLIDDSLHTGTNQDLASADCAACDGYLSLCIQGDSNVYGFYNVIGVQ